MELRSIISGWLRDVLHGEATHARVRAAYMGVQACTRAATERRTAGRYSIAAMSDMPAMPGPCSAFDPCAR